VNIVVARFAPYPLDRAQDPNLIVHQNVVIRRVMALDVVQSVLLVEVNQYGAVESLMQSCSADLLCRNDPRPGWIVRNIFLTDVRVKGAK
jgi:hypothetical protein